MLIVHTFLPKRSQQFFPCHLLLHKTALTQTEKYKSDTYQIHSVQKTGIELQNHNTQQTVTKYQTLNLHYSLKNLYIIIIKSK